MSYLAKVHSTDTAALHVTGAVVYWLPTGEALAAAEQIASNDRNSMRILTDSEMAGMVFVGQQPSYPKDAVAGPITWGLLRPVIVLPAAAGAWTEAQRAAALAHEQAHVARRDWAVHLGAWVVSALFWFHPLVWLARRALVREAEHAADDAALAQGTRPSAYAELLLALAGTPGPRAALGAAPSLLGQRVHAVLDGRSRSARRWPAWVVAGVLGGIGLPALGAWPTWAPTPEAELTCAPAEPDAP